MVRTPGGVVLIDAGLGPRAAAKRMNGTGVSVAVVTALCVTHLVRDQFSPSWLGTLLNRGIRVFCHRARVDEALEILGHESAEALVQGFGDEFEPLAGVKVRTISLAHDSEGSQGFVFDGFGCRLGYATDLGRVPAGFFAHFHRLDVLAIEANYDPAMQLASGRPEFLKRRIMNGAGHLSNEQALAAVRKIIEQSRKRGGRSLRHVVLLHRSRECNCPRLMQAVFDGAMSKHCRLTIAEQYARTVWLRVGPWGPLVGVQLGLGWE
jgi:hypothetical protein